MQQNGSKLKHKAKVDIQQMKYFNAALTRSKLTILNGYKISNFYVSCHYLYMPQFMSYETSV